MDYKSTMTSKNKATEIGPEKLKGFLMIIIATLLWGSAFVVTKGATDSFPAVLLVACRQIIGALTIAFIFRKRLGNFSGEVIKITALLGIIESAGMVFQTLGVKYTTAGRSAFLTAAYCIWTPFTEWLILKRKPETKTLLAAVLCLGGVGLIVLNENLLINIGDVYSLIGSICFAIELVIFGQAVRKHDDTMVSFGMIGFAGIFTLIVSLCVETVPQNVNISTIVGIGYLAIVCTGLTLLLQGASQKILSPSEISVVLGFEAVFAAIFSAIIYRESFRGRTLIGCLLVFLSSFVVLVRIKKNGKAGSR